MNGWEATRRTGDHRREAEELNGSLVDARAFNGTPPTVRYHDGTTFVVGDPGQEVVAEALERAGWHVHWIP